MIEQQQFLKNKELNHGYITTHKMKDNYSKVLEKNVKNIKTGNVMYMYLKSNDFNKFLSL